LFLAFLANKMATMTVKGGNTESLYLLNGQADGRLLMAQSLQQQHPDVVKITRKWNRWQHEVNYKPFKANRFRLRPGVVIPDEPNNYGMVLTKNGKPIESPPTRESGGPEQSANEPQPTDLD